jgi:hypothetical protein
VTFLEVRPSDVPLELQRLPAVLWRAEPRGDDKPAKVPYQIADPVRRAKSTDPATWGTFWDAVDAYAALVTAPADPHRGPIVGVGVVLTAEGGITCLDLDRVLEGDQLDPRAARLVQAWESWTERSPSGTGLHVFVRGQLPKAIKGEQIEVYARDRYIALTGWHWPGTPDTLHDRQALLDRLSAADTPPARPAWTGPSPPPPDDLGGALLARVHAWGIPVGGPLKRWQDGFLLELARCPWADSHTTGPGGAAVMIRASGAFDFTCLHAHCGSRSWRDFRAVMQAPR